MKIRVSFVSNSSSSSFVFSKDKYSSTYDVAIAMIPFRDCYGDNDELIKKVEHIKQLHPDKSPGLSFPSCNYDTYIMDVNNQLWISTCNNHQWPFGRFSYENEDAIRDEVNASKFLWLSSLKVGAKNRYFGFRDKYEGGEYAYSCRNCYSHLRDTKFPTRCTNCGKLFDKRIEE